MKAINNFKKKNLSPNFANDLLNAEMELEVSQKNVDIKVIKFLIELYMVYYRKLIN